MGLSNSEFFELECLVALAHGDMPPDACDYEGMQSSGLIVNQNGTWVVTDEGKVRTAQLREHAE